MTNNKENPKTEHEKTCYKATKNIRRKMHAKVNATNTNTKYKKY